jgi:hypothetical protein
MNGYIYLLRYKDTEGNILNKYGYSKNYPLARLYYWRNKICIDFEFSFIAKCSNYQKLENQIKWFVIDIRKGFLIGNHFELSINAEDEIKDFIKSNGFYQKTVFEN